MEVFRITKADYAYELYAPGLAGRWNLPGEEVIYTASSRSLACLENWVHRSGRGNTVSYRSMIIYVPDHLGITQVNLSQLPEGWNQMAQLVPCQEIGSIWYRSGATPVLKVPSAVIPEEFNYIIHFRHPEFQQIKLIATYDFFFDKRL